MVENFPPIPGVGQTLVCLCGDRNPRPGGRAIVYCRGHIVAEIEFRDGEGRPHFERGSDL